MRQEPTAMIVWKDFGEKADVINSRTNNRVEGLSGLSWADLHTTKYTAYSHGSKAYHEAPGGTFSKVPAGTPMSPQISQHWPCTPEYSPEYVISRSTCNCKCSNVRRRSDK